MRSPGRASARRTNPAMARLRSFYLACAVEKRVVAQRAAAVIVETTGLSCTARWLTGALERMTDSTKAMEDWGDLTAADAFVLLHAPITRGSAWVELGMAIQQHKRIWIVEWNAHSGAHRCELPAFAYLPGIARVASMPMLVRAMLHDISIHRPPPPLRARATLDGELAGSLHTSGTRALLTGEKCDE